MNPEAQALLAELRDIHLPDPGGSALVPMWFILGFVLLLAALSVWLLLRKINRGNAQNHWREQARAELHEIENAVAQRPLADTLSDCSRLLRRISLAVQPRESVAGLTGQAWLNQLDRLHGSHEFNRERNARLLNLAYQSPATIALQSAEWQASDAEIAQPLLDLTGELINTVVITDQKVGDIPA